MSDTLKKRRRWPTIVLVVVLLLLGGAISWRLRALNSTERALVGTWRLASPYDGRYTRRFRPDRTYEDVIETPGGTYTTTGTWTASSTSMRMHDIEYSANTPPSLPRPWNQRLWIALGLGVRLPGVRFDGPDRFRHGDAEFVRVPE